jgi:DNA-binding MarR family transcriptional regulator
MKSQSQHDRILWALSNSSGKMKRSDLRRRVSMKLSDLDHIIEELAKEGHIRISGDMVSLDPAHASRQNS